jgi:hypothetical protein
MTELPPGPPDARAVPRFAGPETFARLPRLAAANVVYELLSLFALEEAPTPPVPGSVSRQTAPGTT